MSGLYNMIMGRNPRFLNLLGLIGMPSSDGHLTAFGRLRDAWISGDGETVTVLHRNYGPNGQAANDAAAKIFGFEKQEACKGFDGTEDETYQMWHFKVLRQLISLGKEEAARSCENRWNTFMQALKDLQTGKKTPQTEKMMDVGKIIMERLKQSIESGDRNIVSNEDGAVDIFQVKGEE